MIDFETLLVSLKNAGYTVEHVIDTPKNAGDAELVVDGKLITVDEARALLVKDETRR